MNYRRLGRTNLQVSEISLGTVELGMDYGIPVQGRASTTVRGRCCPYTQLRARLGRQFN